MKKNSNRQYAELYFHNDSNPLTVLIPNQGVYYNVTSLTKGINNLITNDDDKFVIYEDGVYSLSLSVSFGGGVTREYEFAMFVNDVEQKGCEFHRVMGTGGDVGSGSIECLLELNAGDVVNIKAEDETNPSQNIDVYVLNFNIIRIEGVDSESITNKTIYPRKVCFDTDVCIQGGTDTWVYLRNGNDTTNRNIRGHGAYFTTFLELAPNAKMIFGYTDIDKYITYDSANDELDIVTDNITLSVQNSDFKIKSYKVSSRPLEIVASDGSTLFTMEETGGGMGYMTIRDSGANADIVLRADGGDIKLTPGEVVLGDTNTGTNAGTPLCLGADDTICVCGACA